MGKVFPPQPLSHTISARGLAGVILSSTAVTAATAIATATTAIATPTTATANVAATTTTPIHIIATATTANADTCIYIYTQVYT